jgi:glycosyltransferase involved in cell wall biosynthesis
LAELLDAFSEIRKTKTNLHLNIVGWEDDTKKPVESELKILCQKLNIEAFVTFHGFKSVGHELNEMYRMADIYILPSYHEGFPRTIWEAMANSLPVICTSVGSIPLELVNEQDALIVQPKRGQEIEKAINRLLTNPSIRRSLIKNGRVKASNNTLEKQTKKLIKLISHE